MLDGSAILTGRDMNRLVIYRVNKITNNYETLRLAFIFQFGNKLENESITKCVASRNAIVETSFIEQPQVEQ